MAKVTLEDVARLANVSLTTVSRSLRDEPGISSATREQVKKIAKRLGYVPNMAGAALSTGRMRSVVYVLPTSSVGTLQMDVLTALVEELAAHGYHTTVLSEEILLKKGFSIFEVDKVAHADAVVVTLEHGRMISDLKVDATLPMVIVNRVLYGAAADFVVADEERGAHTATSYLIGLGHKRIAHVTSGPTNEGLTHRLNGYESALRSAGISVDPALIVRKGPISSEGGQQAMEHLIHSGVEFSAIFCGTDLLMPGVMRSLRAHGLSVPKDVSVVSFDDLLAAELLDPPLTTIRKPRHEMGIEAARMVIKRLSEPSRPSPITTVLQAQLVERNSTGVLKKTYHRT